MDGEVAPGTEGALGAETALGAARFLVDDDGAGERDALADGELVGGLDEVAIRKTLLVD
ncbi:MAG: hypothetical protein ABI661_10450 [Gammaproteobacteria bacterium]